MDWLRADIMQMGPGLAGLCVHAHVCKGDLPILPHDHGQAQAPGASQGGDFFLV